MAPTASNSIPVTMSTARRSLKAQMLGQWASGKRLGSSPIWLGAPGMAKTAICKDVACEVARELGRSVLVITVFLVDREVPDLRGMALPVKNMDTNSYEYIAYTRAGILPNPDLELAYDHVLLLIDEVPAATLDHIKSVASVFLDYVAGDTVLDPAKYFVVGTGNRTQDRSGAARLPSHFVNRVRLLEIEPDVRPWLDWSADPANNVPMLARTFVHMRPALFTSARVPDEANASFCTLRSFTNGIQALMRDFAHDPATVDPADPGVFDAAFSPDHVGDATALLAGDIGAAVAREFITFAKVRHSLKTLAEILADPHNCDLPVDPSALYAQASYIVSWTTKANCEKLMIYVARLRPDLRVPTIQQMLKREPAVARSAVYAETMKHNFGLMQAVAATAQR